MDRTTAPAATKQRQAWGAYEMRLVIVLPPRSFCGCIGSHRRKGDLLCSAWQLRREQRCGNARRKIPLAEHRAELRLGRRRLVSDHDLARDPLRPGVDPDLPVDVLLDEGQRFAALSIHVAGTEIKAKLHVSAHGPVWIAVKEVGERRCKV